MDAEAKDTAVLSPREDFDRALAVTAELLRDGKMHLFVPNTGALECEVKDADVAAACSRREADEGGFQRVFRTEIWSALLLLAEGTLRDDWKLPTGLHEKANDGERAEWEQRVEAAREVLGDAEAPLVRHYEFKTQGLLPGLTGLKTEMLDRAAETGRDGRDARAVVLRLSAGERVPSGWSGGRRDDPFKALRSLFAAPDEDSVTVVCDATDLDYLIRHLEEVRDGLAGEN